MKRIPILAVAGLMALPSLALAQPKPSGTPDRPVSTGTNTTATGSPSMVPNPTREPGGTASPGPSSQPTGADAPSRTNGRQDTPRR